MTRPTVAPLLTAAILLGTVFAWLHSVQRVVERESPVLHDTHRAFDPQTVRPGSSRLPESPAAAELRMTSERAARGTLLLSK